MKNRINVQLVGVLREHAGKTTFSLEFDGCVFVEDVIAELTDSLPPEFKRVLVDSELNDPRPNVLLLLNKKEVSALNGLRTRVGNGDTLVLIPVSHGG